MTSGSCLSALGISFCQGGRVLLASWRSWVGSRTHPSIESTDQSLCTVSDRCAFLGCQPSHSCQWVLFMPEWKLPGLQVLSWSPVLPSESGWPGLTFRSTTQLDFFLCKLSKCHQSAYPKECHLLGVPLDGSIEPRYGASLALAWGKSVGTKKNA